MQKQLTVEPTSTPVTVDIEVNDAKLVYTATSETEAKILIPPQVIKATQTGGTPPDVTPPIPPIPPDVDYGDIVLEKGYENAADVTTNQGQYNTRSNTIKKTGDWSFRSEVRVNQEALYGGWRSEMQYPSLPPECVIEYDVYYENWHRFADLGHTFQCHHPTNTGGTPLSLQNYSAKFVIVRLVNNVFNAEPVSNQKAVEPNRWYNHRWEVKWSNGATNGYIKLYIDNVLYYNYSGITNDSQGVPYLKIGQNRWPDPKGSQIKETAVVYYDNVKVWKVVKAVAAQVAVENEFYKPEEE